MWAAISDPAPQQVHMTSQSVSKAWGAAPVQIASPRSLSQLQELLGHDVLRCGTIHAQDELQPALQGQQAPVQRRRWWVSAMRGCVVLLVREACRVCLQGMLSCMLLMAGLI